MITELSLEPDDLPIQLSIKPIQQAENALRLHIENNYVPYQAPGAPRSAHRARAEYLRVKELLEFELELARKSQATEWR